MKPDIIQKIEMTKETIKTSLDSFIKDNITDVYNEVFFKEYLKNYINILNHQDSKKNVAIMIINVDNMSEFNIKYSNKAGDETIKGLGYLLNQTISIRNRTCHRHFDFVWNKQNKSKIFESSAILVSRDSQSMNLKEIPSKGFAKQIFVIPPGKSTSKSSVDS